MKGANADHHWSELSTLEFSAKSVVWNSKWLISFNANFSHFLSFLNFFFFFPRNEENYQILQKSFRAIHSLKLSLWFFLDKAFAFLKKYLISKKKFQIFLGEVFFGNCDPKFRTPQFFPVLESKDLFPFKFSDNLQTPRFFQSILKCHFRNRGFWKMVVVIYFNGKGSKILKKLFILGLNFPELPSSDLPQFKVSDFSVDGSSCSRKVSEWVGQGLGQTRLGAIR